MRDHRLLDHCEYSNTSLVAQPLTTTIRSVRGDKAERKLLLDGLISLADLAMEAFNDLVIETLSRFFKQRRANPATESV